MNDRDPKRMTLAERIVYAKTWSKTFRRFIEMLPRSVTPNVVTLLRAALAVPVYMTLSTGRYWTALALFAAAMALDVVDGAIAHVRDMHTATGAFLDPLADKLILCAALAAVWRSLPIWFLAVVAATLVFAAGITLLRIARIALARDMNGPALARTVEAKPAGKMKTIFDVVSALLVIVGLGLGSSATIDAAGALLVAGTLLAMLLHVRRERPNDHERPVA